MSVINRSSEFKKGIKAFIQHVETLESANDGFFDEYTMIQEAQMRSRGDSLISMDIGKLEVNLKKNRYKDIVPYDEYRIVLSHCEGDECSDYINASKVMGAGGSVDYIAAQGPLPGTVNDFWRMIWEYEVEIVFMACRLVENDRVKCSQYWADVGSSAEFGNISVFTVSEEEIVHECLQRIFRVTNGGEVHTVTHLHYYGWPDHGIPKNPDDIRDIIDNMRSIRLNSKAPALVHCSAGCGRTGTIIAIDYVWTLLETGKFDESFSLFNLICYLRTQRVSLVQTPDQYALVNKVLKSLCEEMLTKIATHTYENVEFNKGPSNNESNQQSPKDLPYDASKKVQGNLSVSNVNTQGSTQPTQIDSLHSSAITDTAGNSRPLPRPPSSTEISKMSDLQTLTPPPLPTSTKNVYERSLKTSPQPMSTAQGTTGSNSQTLPRSLPSAERSTTSGLKTSTPSSMSSSTKSFIEQTLKTLPRSVTTVESTDGRNARTLPRSVTTVESTAGRNARTLPRSSPSDHSTADEIRRHLQTTSLFSPGHIQKPQEQMDNPINSRRWSSMKSYRTPMQTTDSSFYTNAAISAQPGRLNVPARYSSIKVSAGNKVYNFSTQPENRRLKGSSDQGTRGIHYTTPGSEIPISKQTISYSREQRHDMSSTGPPASPKFKGFVRLTPENTPSYEGRGHRHT
ncbi:hypothetical protein BsWGS_13505 [Bradybaena similaris]